MEEQQRNIDSDEKVIDLQDLFSELLRHLGSILIVSIVVAVIAGVISYAISAADLAQDQAEDINVMTQSQAQAKENLTQAEIDKVEQLFYQYTNLHTQTEREASYYSDSILYNLDPSSIREYQIEYLYTSSNPDIAKAMSNQLLDEDDYKKIAEIMGKPDSYLYSYELIDAYDADTDSSSSEPVYIIDGQDYLYRGAFYVSIKAETEDEINQIADVVRQAMTDHVADLQDSDPDLEVTETGAQYVTTIASSTLPSDAAVDATAISDLESKVSSLSDDEQNYYQYLLNREMKVRGSYTVEDNTAGTVVRATAIALVCAFAVMIILYVLAYVMTGSVKTIEDLSMLSGRAVLGVLRTPVSYRGINGPAERAADRIACHGNRYELEVQSSLIANRIQRFTRNANRNHVFLVLDSATDEERDLLKKACQSPELNGLTIEMGNPSVDTDFLKKMDAQSVCVLVGKLKVSKAQDLQNNITICRETGSEMIGMVAVL